MKTIYISGEIGWDVTADDIREQIDSKSKEKLRVIINSPGGYVSEGFEIYNILKAYSGDVEIVIGVMAASIAAYMAMAAPLEKRVGFKNSSFMKHEASGGVYGRSRDFKIKADRLNGINNIMAEAFSEGMGITKEQALKNMEEDFYMTGWESLVENNVISNIIDIEDVEIPQKEEEDDFILFEMLAKEVDKPQAESIIKAKMYETEDKMRKNIEKSSLDLEKAAAHFTEHKQVEKPEKNNTEEINMDFDQLLKDNPEAKAEHETRLQSAEENGKSEAKKEFDAKMKNAVEVLEIEGVELSENAVEAMNGKKSINDFMKDKIKAQKDKRENVKEKIDFGVLIAKGTPGDQDKTQNLSKEEIEAKNKEVNEKINAFANSTNSGGTF